MSIDSAGQPHSDGLVFFRYYNTSFEIFVFMSLSIRQELKEDKLPLLYLKFREGRSKFLLSV
ncbi:hypothetical protein HQ45_09625 [Porphyromonas crevioricanis]|nr:hypothetical protein HQ45_09625 [Porphyromonas crevioricanis]GAD06873.1 hypothetical protein PORCAN_481 [Porphyromonas crevioricanis JCM 13913]